MSSTHTHVTKINHEICSWSKTLTYETNPANQDKNKHAWNNTSDNQTILRVHRLLSYSNSHEQFENISFKINPGSDIMKWITVLQQHQCFYLVETFQFLANIPLDSYSPLYDTSVAPVQWILYTLGTFSLVCHLSQKLLEQVTLQKAVVIIKQTNKTKDKQTKFKVCLQWLDYKTVLIKDPYPNQA